MLRDLLWPSLLSGKKHLNKLLFTFFIHKAFCYGLMHCEVFCIAKLNVSGSRLVFIHYNKPFLTDNTFLGVCKCISQSKMQPTLDRPLHLWGETPLTRPADWCHLECCTFCTVHGRAFLQTRPLTHNLWCSVKKGWDWVHLQISKHLLNLSGYVI